MTEVEILPWQRVVDAERAAILRMHVAYLNIICALPRPLGRLALWEYKRRLHAR